MRKVLFLIKLSRPEQWIKNFFVFAGIVFSGQITNVTAVLNSIIAFILFCIASSLIYVLNDLVDIEKDKLHPKKKLRPLAAGHLKKSDTYVYVLILTACLIGGYFWSIAVSIIISTYIIINILYAVCFKNIVIIDVFSIASGFVLRVVAGAVAVSAMPSPWLLLCTLLLALFLALGKRRHELLLLQNNAKDHRANLGEYNIDLINQWTSITTATTILTYSLYTFIELSHIWMMTTIPFVIYGLFRYQYLVFVKKQGGSPEKILISDTPFIINGLLWASTVFFIVYLL